MAPPSLKHLACKVEGCRRKHQAKGYCDSHYYNMYWVIKNGKKCSECDGPVKAKGLCEKHYKRQYRGSKQSNIPDMIANL